ncbi:hypothetical protein [Bacteroides acidifaciens]|uniref:hypothetical protein n=1 Tax=Bacteroides acidifaciens TaxID=85831 RepID=UPI0025B08BA9|nr:hypothetical protein [Bacteroides acidifaciens]
MMATVPWRYLDKFLGFRKGYCAVKDFHIGCDRIVEGYVSSPIQLSIETIIVFRGGYVLNIHVC